MIAGIAKLICVPLMPDTATPRTLPAASRTGPPELPGFMPPLTWMLSSVFIGVLRKLEIDDSLIVMFRPSCEPNGKPKT